TGWFTVVSTSNTTPIIAAGYNVTVIDATHFTVPVNVISGGAQTNSFFERFMTAFDYPIKDQIGVGIDPKAAHSQPGYVFNNLKNGSPWTRNLANAQIAPGAIDLYRQQTGNPSATFTEADVIQSNRDFFSDAGFDTNTGVSRGTKAQM